MEDREEHSIHDFLTVSEMDNFNDKVKMVMNKKPAGDAKTPEPVTKEPLVTESYTVNPTEISDDVLYQLADIIDGKTHFNTNDIKEEEPEGPTAKDKILGSIAIAYTTENNLPIAVALLEDPTVENYNNIIPSDYYELKSGKSLEQRIQQEFFAFKPDKYSPEVGKELKQLLESNSPNLFIVTSSINDQSTKYLAECEYRMVSTFKTEWEKNPVNLWINWHNNITL